MYFAVLHFSDIALFLQTEGKTLHQQKVYDLIYCDIYFIAVFWKRTNNIFEVCLYILSNLLRFNLWPRLSWSNCYHKIRLLNDPPRILLIYHLHFVSELYCAVFFLVECLFDITQDIICIFVFRMFYAFQ